MPTIHLFYRKNIRTKELAQQAMWVVRANSDPASDKQFILTPGQHGARANSFKNAHTYISLQYGISELYQLSRGLWSSEHIDKIRTKAILRHDFVLEPEPELVEV